MFLSVQPIKMKKAEALLCVRFNSNYSLEELNEICLSDLENLRFVPGLVQKYYVTEEYSGAVSYLAHQNGVKDELSAIENLRIACGVSGNVLSKADAQTVLSQVGLSRQQHLPARSLSAGQKRRVALARLLRSSATLWLLDEVLTSLDDTAIKLSRQFIGDHLRKGGLAIIATHQELDLVAQRIQRIELSP